MTVDTFFGDAADGYLQSESTVYATARSGGTITGSTTTDVYAGQYTSGSFFECLESFIKFDTSSIPDADAVSASVLSMFGSLNNSGGVDTTIEARIFDWGLTNTSADWVPGASLSGQTLVASIPTGSYAAAYMDFTSDAAFPANVNKTGFTFIVLDGARLVAGTTPGAPAEYIGFKSADATGTTNDPKLVVTHAAASTKSSPLFQPRMVRWPVRRQF